MQTERTETKTHKQRRDKDIQTEKRQRHVSKCSLYVFTITPPRLTDPCNFITVLLVTREPEQTTLLF